MENFLPKKNRHSKYEFSVEGAYAPGIRIEFTKKLQVFYKFRSLKATRKKTKKTQKLPTPRGKGE
jgi:hypothetical protein